MNEGAGIAHADGGDIFDAPPRTPCPTVILRHEVPDGTSHFDWMLAVEPNGDEPLVTFRTGMRVDELSLADTPVGEVDLTMLGRHRPKYLDYEGPLSGDRGHVARVRRGIVKRWSIEGPARWRIAVHWAASAGDGHESQELLLESSPADIMHWRARVVKPALCVDEAESGQGAEHGHGKIRRQRPE